jgi:hypothetical protein
MTNQKGRGKFQGEGRSRFPAGMTERKAKAKANTGVLRFAQDDGEKPAVTTARAKTRAKTKYRDLSAAHHKDKNVVLRSR